MSKSIANSTNILPNYGWFLSAQLHMIIRFLSLYTCQFSCLLMFRLLNSIGKEEQGKSVKDHITLLFKKNLVFS